MVTQLYVKKLDYDGKFLKPRYEKVNWNLLKVTPNYKIKEVIEQEIHKAVNTELEYINIREYLESVMKKLGVDEE